MKFDYLLPFTMVILSFGSSLIFLILKDYKQALYYLCSAIIIYSVTFL